MIRQSQGDKQLSVESRLCKLALSFHYSNKNMNGYLKKKFTTFWKNYMAYLRLVYYYHLFIGFAEMYNKTYLRFLGGVLGSRWAAERMWQVILYFSGGLSEIPSLHTQRRKYGQTRKIYIVKSQVSVQHQYIQKVTLNG